MTTDKGRSIWVRTTGKPVIVDGEVKKLVGLIQDISEKKKNFEELEQYRRHLEYLVERRTEQLNEAVIKAEAAKITLEQTSFHLSSIFDHIHSILRHQAQSKALDIYIDTAGVPI